MSSQNQREVTVAELIPLLRVWQHHKDKPVACPICATGSLTIVDRSARPHREWYAISCASCGFEKTVGVSLYSGGA
jgi:hypothetical protein